MDEPRLIDIAVSIGYGANTQQAYVQILIEAADWMSQMSPSNARELAHNLLAAAEAAEVDEFLIGFVRDKAGGDLPTQAAILDEFRLYRARKDTAQ